MHAVPYWRLSAYYFLYFAFIGVYSPYFALYLQSLSFSAWDISVLMTQIQIMRLIGPMFWSSLVDRCGHRMTVVRLTSAVMLAVFCLLFVVEGFDAVLLTMCVFSFFWVAALPLMETLTFDHLRLDPGRYSRVRVWGSISFVVVVLGVGALLDRWPPSSLLWFCGLSLAATFLCALLVPEAPMATEHEAALPIGAILRQKRVVALLSSSFAMAAAHGVLNIFYTIFLSEHGYAKATIGSLWTLGVLVEIGIFIAMPRIVRRFSARQVLLACFAAATLRFVSIGLFVDSLVVLAVLQLLHGLTFGASHAASISAVNRWFPGRTRARGQALYSSISFGAGGAVGGLSSGLVWDALGGAAAFAFGSAYALAGLAVVFFWVTAEQVSQNAGRRVIIDSGAGSAGPARSKGSE